jgi:hypothetical protein
MNEYVGIILLQLTLGEEETELSVPPVTSLFTLNLLTRLRCSANFILELI